MPVVEDLLMDTVATPKELQQIRDFPTMEILISLISLGFTVLILLLLGLNEYIQYRRSRNADYQVNPEVIASPQPVAGAPTIPQSKDEHF